MGIWDDLKSRFGRGRQDDVYDDYDDGYYDDYHESYSGYQDDDGYYDGSRADDSTATSPLVNMTDIRSQPVSFSRGAGSREDRIPMPVVRERKPHLAPGLSSEDSEAMRDGLAHSNQNSLVQLHSERIQLEANALPEFNLPENPRRQNIFGGSEQIRGLADQNAISRYTNAGTSRSNAGMVTPRSSRRLEKLRPQSYADAEEISIRLRQGAVVVLDLTSVRPELAKRILDFSFGVTSAFEGQVDRFADRVYILTRNGALTESERNQIRL